jgi:hypothetical protein
MKTDTEQTANTKGSLVLPATSTIRRASVEWELKDGNFSASGSIKYKNGGESGGQNLETLAREYPANEKLLRIVAVWRKWHLNDMNAGFPVQHDEINRQIELAKVAHPEIVYSDGDVNFYKLADLEGLNKDKPSYSTLGAGHYDLCLHWLKAAGLYEIPLPVGAECTGDFPAEVLNGTRGYRYGERWVRQMLPDEVVAEILSW